MSRAVFETFNFVSVSRNHFFFEFYHFFFNFQVSFTFDQNDEHGVKVQCNMSDLCLNVSPRSITIIQNSVQAFFESMNDERDPSDSAITESEEDHGDLWLPK